MVSQCTSECLMLSRQGWYQLNRPQGRKACLACSQLRDLDSSPNDSLSLLRLRDHPPFSYNIILETAQHSLNHGITASSTRFTFSFLLYSFILLIFNFFFPSCSSYVPLVMVFRSPSHFVSTTLYLASITFLHRIEDIGSRLL